MWALCSALDSAIVTCCFSVYTKSYIGVSVDALVVYTAGIYPSFRLALVTHPDKNPSQKATDAFRRLSEAFDCLRDPCAQKMYLRDLCVRGGSCTRSKRRTGASAGGRESGGSSSIAERAREKWWEKRTWKEVRRQMRTFSVLVPREFFRPGRLRESCKSRRSLSKGSCRQAGKLTRRERERGSHCVTLVVLCGRFL